MNQKRVVLEHLTPELDGGVYPVRRIVGDVLVVEVDVFADGRDAISVVLKSQPENAESWNSVPMAEMGNDRWKGTFCLGQPGVYHYTVEAWVNWFRSWYRQLQEKLQASLDIRRHLTRGASLVERVADLAADSDAIELRDWVNLLRNRESAAVERLGGGHVRDSLDAILNRYRDPRAATQYPPRRVVVDRRLASFGAWYEVFPRSCATEAGRHGTLRDLAERLHYVAEMGFDVVYLPPIHPIGRTSRKGENNSLVANGSDPGSPWAIGSKHGGHKSVHPELGTLEDVQRLLSVARDVGVEIALDMALQCSPDHPYVQEHPDWFRREADGSIEFAEDPPNQYEDVYPFDFSVGHGLWEEMRSIFEYWIHQGLRTFRVDNPHTKPLAFWEWLIADLKSRWPELVFLSEGLTRPRLMVRLAKIGFTQSYDYFPWKNKKAELTEYYTLLNTGDFKEYFRPNLWINTPQFLPPILQTGGRPAFISRLILAATIGAAYGIYGPAFELCENQAVDGTTEYRDSEQYELRCWDWDAASSVRQVISRINEIRRHNVALQTSQSLWFHSVDNDEIIAYSKTSSDFRNVILTVVNLDPRNRQSGWVELALDRVGLNAQDRYIAHDLLGNSRYAWQGSRNFVDLDPSEMPAHVLRFEQYG